MVKIDLNEEFDFYINEPYSFTEDDELIVKSHIPEKADDWGNSHYENVKQKIKRDHLLKQNDRCAYCRKYIEPDGKYEPIEHIVAKSIKPKWMLEVKNLIVTCDHCNNIKNDENTLKEEFKSNEKFPNSSDAFTIFNPHYDKWSEHFNIENDIFLTAKPDSKGSNTIKICKLFRYHVPINNARELSMKKSDSFINIIHRMYEIKDKNSNEYIQLIEAMTYLEHRIEKKELDYLKNTYKKVYPK